MIKIMMLPKGIIKEALQTGQMIITGQQVMIIKQIIKDKFIFSCNF